MKFINDNKAKLAVILLLSAVIFLLCFTLQKKSPTLKTYTSVTPTIVCKKLIQNITYKTVDTSNLKLDLYLPKITNKAKAPLVIYIHGGGWSAGNKMRILKNYRPFLLNALLEKGYAVASINYRLASSKTIFFPAPVEDCKDAINWLHANAATYNLDSNNFGLWGSSAGAHLALLTTYSPETSLFHSNSSQINYVIDCFGATDLNALLRPELSDFSLRLLKLYSEEMYNKREARLQVFTALDISKNKEKVSEVLNLYSPINYVNKHTVPTLILHGSVDETVSLKQSELLDKELTLNKVPHEFKIFENQKHGLKTLSKSETDELIKTTIDFVQAYRK